MKTEEWRKLTEEEIEQKVFELKEELFNLRFQKALGEKLQNTSRISQVKRDIARGKTIWKEKTPTPNPSP